jgi:Fe-S oxidoreductase
MEMDQNELRRLEEKCIQENPPACTAGCPLHVDARKFLQLLGQRDLQGAWAVLRQRQPFPGIIGRICDHPCEDVCRRREAGGTIAVGALERHCVENHGYGMEILRPPLPKSQRVAVAGSGLRGLTAAYDLAKKGYGVTLFEKGDRLGGSLWLQSAERLPRSVIEEELLGLETLKVDVKLNTAVSSEYLQELIRIYDAVYLALPPDAAKDLPGRFPAADPQTGATALPGVFAGTFEGDAVSVYAAADGRKAALTIDRFLQGASLTAAREREGAYSSTLYVNMTSVSPLAPAIVSGGSTCTAEAAWQEAKRCIDCQCLECVKVCKYLEYYKGYPKKYVREIYNNAAIVKGTHYANKMINSCSLCSLCAEVCPNALDMGRVCLASRQEMVRKNKMPPSAHDFALRDMEFSNSVYFAMARHRPGFSSSRFAFFPGCQLSGSSPGQVKQVYDLLTSRLEGGVGLMLRCCGAPADWAGEEALFKESIDQLYAEWERLGKPELIVACSSCFAMFKGKFPVRSLWEVLAAIELPLPAAPVRPLRLAVQDPCTTRHEAGIQEAVRKILGSLGHDLQELPLHKELTECCGFGGLMGYANPALAKLVTEGRAQESPLDYVTYCAMCRDRFAAAGKRTVHILDLIFPEGTSDLAARRDPGFTRRHENRAQLKRSLLYEKWQEKEPMEAAYRSIKLYCSEEIRKRLEERLILDEDIQQVIEAAERTGRKFSDPENGHSLAHHRPAKVTYWVEYSPEADGYRIHNAYSHRMEVIEDVKP